MTRDPSIYARAARLLERLYRHARKWRMTNEEFQKRENRLILAHYRAQHSAGATDYPKPL